MLPIATQPSAMYTAAVTQRGGVSQTRFSTMPATAPLHTAISIAFPSVPDRTSTQNGVYVPAIRTKIIEWSSRRIQARAERVQVMRWYSALVPSRAQTENAEIDAAT